MPLSVGELDPQFLSNTMSPELRPTSVSSGIFRYISGFAETESSFNGQMVEDKSIYCIKVEYRKLGPASSFMRFPPYFYFRFPRTRESGGFYRFLSDRV